MLRRVLLIAAVGAVAGCGGGDDGAPDRQTRTGPANAQTTAGERLDRAPSPITAEELGKFREGSVEATINTIWFYAQWGASPNIVAMYDDRARRAVGSGRIASAYSYARPEALNSRPRIVGTRPARNGTLVMVRALSKDAPPQHESFLLVRRDGEWRVLHDSFLERNIVPVVRAEVQTRVAPRAKETVGEAEHAAAEVASRLRNVAIP